MLLCCSTKSFWISGAADSGISAGHSSVIVKSHWSKIFFSKRAFNFGSSASTHFCGSWEENFSITTSQHLVIRHILWTSTGPAGFLRPAGAARKSSTMRLAAKIRDDDVFLNLWAHSGAMTSGSAPRRKVGQPIPP